MKKLFGLVALLCVLVLASCSNVSQKYADKINEAEEKLTYAEVMEDLGDEAIAIGVGGDYYTGLVVAVKGCESLDEINAKLEAGEEVKGITITFLLGKAQSASYDVIEEDDLK